MFIPIEDNKFTEGFSEFKFNPNEEDKVEAGEEKKEEKTAPQTSTGGLLLKSLIPGIGSPQKAPAKGLSKSLQVLSISIFPRKINRQQST